jgi:hypothetical protein
MTVVLLDQEHAGVLLDQEHAGEPDQRGVVGKDADDV